MMTATMYMMLAALLAVPAGIAAAGDSFDVDLPDVGKSMDTSEMKEHEMERARECMESGDGDGEKERAREQREEMQGECNEEQKKREEAGETSGEEREPELREKARKRKGSEM